MLLAGVGFLLPYNSFITDVDYLHQKFKGINMDECAQSHVCGYGAAALDYAVTSLPCVSGTSIVFDMSLTYILVALLAVILNNVLVERLSMHTRITVGKSERRQEHRSSGKLKTVPLKLTLLLIKYFGSTQS